MKISDLQRYICRFYNFLCSGFTFPHRIYFPMQYVKWILYSIDYKLCMLALKIIGDRLVSPIRRTNENKMIHCKRINICLHCKCHLSCSFWFLCGIWSFVMQSEKDKDYRYIDSDFGDLNYVSSHLAFSYSIICNKYQ